MRPAPPGQVRCTGAPRPPARPPGTHSTRWGWRPPAATACGRWAAGCAPGTPASRACSSGRCLSPPCAARCPSSAASGSPRSRCWGGGTGGALTCRAHPHACPHALPLRGNARHHPDPPLGAPVSAAQGPLYSGAWQQPHRSAPRLECSGTLCHSLRFRLTALNTRPSQSSRHFSSQEAGGGVPAPVGRRQRCRPGPRTPGWTVLGSWLQLHANPGAEWELGGAGVPPKWERPTWTESFLSLSDVQV